MFFPKKKFSCGMFFAPVDTLYSPCSSLPHQADLCG